LSNLDKRLNRLQKKLIDKIESETLCCMNCGHWGAEGPNIGENRSCSVKGMVTTKGSNCEGFSPKEGMSISAEVYAHTCNLTISEINANMNELFNSYVHTKGVPPVNVHGEYLLCFSLNPVIYKRVFKAYQEQVNPAMPTSRLPKFTYRNVPVRMHPHIEPVELHEE